MKFLDEFIAFNEESEQRSLLQSTASPCEAFIRPLRETLYGLTLALLSSTYLTLPLKFI